MARLNPVCHCEHREAIASERNCSGVVRVRLLRGARNDRRLAASLFLLLLATLPAAAHVIDADLSKLSRTAIFCTYIQLGFTHIIPLGFDHILFIISLYILEPRLKPVLWQATAFTVAHS
ncbi:MAG: hypothetical protein EOO62_25115, partial [Hymenobacter sp.]